MVWASSETLIGLPFEHEQPRYAPIDEDHPVLPESHYALAKEVGEVLARQFHRWTGVPLIALRISNIMTESDYERFPSFWDDPRLRAWNLWGYVDARDVAQAARLALQSDVSGAEAFLVAAADTCMTRKALSCYGRSIPMSPPPNRSRDTRRCWPSTKPGACWATNPLTPGGTTSPIVDLPAVSLLSSRQVKLLGSHTQKRQDRTQGSKGPCQQSQRPVL